MYVQYQSTFKVAPFPELLRLRARKTSVLYYFCPAYDFVGIISSRYCGAAIP